VAFGIHALPVRLLIRITLGEHLQDFGGIAALWVAAVAFVVMALAGPLARARSSL
jgi:hypothetical protein